MTFQDEKPLAVRIMGTASQLPGRSVANAEIAQQALPDTDPATIEARTGIATRYWTPRDAPAAVLAADALGRACAAAGLAPAALRRIFYVSSTGGDRLIPSNGSDLSHALGLTGSCDTIDINNGCMGFLSAVDLAARTVQTGLHPVGIVVAETLSRFITPADPRPYQVFGDAVAAVVLGPGRAGEGILRAHFGVDRSLGESARLAHSGLTHAPAYIEFAASNRALTDLAMRTLLDTVTAVCDDVQDMDWVLPHQPNGRMLDRFIQALAIAPERVVPVVREIGSVGAAAIPVSLDRLFRSGRLQPGQRVLMAGIGTGVSYGAMVYQVTA